MVVDPSRARGALLGLAAGDAYGRPLEFIRPPQVRTHPVEIAPGRFKWTDDTHMALYLGRAILDVAPEALAPGGLDESLVGHAIGARFVEWLDDPLMPFTAPGRTCITGAEAYRRSGDWRTSGVGESDGCGAVMRICPVGIALDGEELIAVARVSAVVTHAHPNATATAAVATWLLRQVLEGRALDAVLVGEGAALARARWPEAKDVAAALDAAVVEAGATGEWLDEGAIPAGDGGWRSPSALGLGLAAALRWGGATPAAFATAVERAARIAGDSDSVACLTGMYLGAAHGEAVIPRSWVEALPQEDDLVALAEALVTRDRERRVPRRARTSATHPLYVDTVLRDRLGITFLPGKHAPSAFGLPWARDLGADLDRLREWGTTLLVSLVEDHELRDLRVPTLVEEAERRGIRVLRSPIRDGGVPTLAQAGEVVAAVEAEMAAGKVVIHCRGGLGRAGTIAACVLAARGMPAADAIRLVRSVRPGAVETSGQEAFVAAFAAWTGRAPS